MQTCIKCPKCGTLLVTNPLAESVWCNLICPNMDCDYDEESEAENRRKLNAKRTDKS
jgi:hypothetical protein